MPRWLDRPREALLMVHREGTLVSTTGISATRAKRDFLSFHDLGEAALRGIFARAAELKRPLFVLWLDAHPDFHTLDTTTSGNLHGVPLAYASGQQGFEGYFPDLAVVVPPERICVLGVRSVDRIISSRRLTRLRLADIARIAGSIDKVRPFITAFDWTPGGQIDDAKLRQRLVPPPQQLSLF